MDILEYANKIHANIDKSKHNFPYVGMVNNQLIGHISECKYCYQCGKIKAECTNPKNESNFCFFGWYSGGKIGDHNCHNFEVNPYWRSVSNDYFYNRKASIIQMENEGVIDKIKDLDTTNKNDISEYFFKPYSVFMLTNDILDEDKLKKDHPILSATPVEKIIIRVPRIENEKELFNFLFTKIKSNLKLAFIPHLVLDTFNDNNYNAKVKRIINEAFNDFLCDIRTRFTQARPIQTNEIMNLSWLNYSYSWVDFKDSLKGKSFLCISGGPSINTQIEWIKLNRDKFIVFCVATIADVLFKNNIIPDLIGTIEMKDSNKHYLNPLKNYNIDDSYLLFEIDSYYDTVNSYDGDKIMVCADALSFPITTEFFNETNSIKFQKHGTVAGLIYSFACLCGAKDIYLAGYDLSYVGTGASHADGVGNISMHDIEIVEQNGNYFIKEFDYNFIAEKALANDGTEVYTTQQFKTYKLRIEQEIEIHGIPTYDLASKGVKKSGAIYKKLDDIKLEDCNIKLKDVVKNFNKKKFKDKEVKEKLLSLYNDKFLIYENHYVIYSYIINQLQLNPVYNKDGLIKKIYLKLKEKSEQEIKEYANRSVELFEKRKINEKKRGLKC